ncbi:MAG: M14 family zinc carboxypeptidase [Eubacteriales bacterium]|nr:M14 family zinc carboxypeptidase [Eubacteriales bacterium]
MIALEERYTYERISEEMEALVQQFGEILSSKVIGYSHDDREIRMLKLGLGEEVLFCTAGVHGRETINPIILLKMIEEYANAYTERKLLADRYDVWQILQNYSIFWIPVVNPDGYSIALQGFQVIRNPKLRQALRIRRLDYRNWKCNARGIDINRNFPCKSYIKRFYYDAPASERETQALIRVFRSCPSVGYVDFHSRGKMIYYYRSALSGVYNRQNYYLARRLQEVSNYRLGQREEEFSADYSGGNSVHYYSEVIGGPAITVETVEENAKFPLKEEYQTDAYREVCCIPLEILAQTMQSSCRKKC